jgi:hypothetical protein
MTLEEFHDARVWSDDIAAHIRDTGLSKAKGYIYVDALYIEQVQPDWPEATRKRGRWHLVLGNAEYVTDDLPRLEALLYEFALGEGYCEGPEAAAGPEPGGEAEHFDESVDDATHGVMSTFAWLPKLPTDTDEQWTLMVRINDALTAIMQDYREPKPAQEE